MRCHFAIYFWISLFLRPSHAFWRLFRGRSTVAPELEEYGPAEVVDNLEMWKSDLALMFYAPWCDYCKQLSPGWLLIRNNLQNANLKIGKFDCERNADNKALCERIGVDRYPSLYYFGYGDFRQSIDGVTMPDELSGHIARYEGELYLDGLYDWVWMLSKISLADRAYNTITTSFLNPMANGRHKTRIRELEAEVAELKKIVSASAEKINEYETIELFDTLPMEGDVFKAMHKEDPSDGNLSFRVCVSELAKEYCRHSKDDPYCADALPGCASSFFESDTCRPAACPMKPRGCRVVSTCLRDGVADEFQISIDDHFRSDNA